jgi:hypothetical protein
VKTKEIQFLGCCSGGCQSGNNTPSRGGLYIQLEAGDDVEDGEMVCLRCAEKLATRILKSAAECRVRISMGQDYRAERWHAPKKAEVTP